MLQPLEPFFRPDNAKRWSHRSKHGSDAMACDGIDWMSSSGICQPESIWTTCQAEGVNQIEERMRLYGRNLAQLQVRLDEDLKAAKAKQDGFGPPAFMADTIPNSPVDGAEFVQDGAEFRTPVKLGISEDLPRAISRFSLPHASCNAGFITPTRSEITDAMAQDRRAIEGRDAESGPGDLAQHIHVPIRRLCSDVPGTAATPPKPTRRAYTPQRSLRLPKGTPSCGLISVPVEVSGAPYPRGSMAPSSSESAVRRMPSHTPSSDTDGSTCRVPSYTPPRTSIGARCTSSYAPHRSTSYAPPATSPEQGLRLPSYTSQSRSCSHVAPAAPPERGLHSSTRAAPVVSPEQVFRVTVAQHSNSYAALPGAERSRLNLASMSFGSVMGFGHAGQRDAVAGSSPAGFGQDQILAPMNVFRDFSLGPCRRDSSPMLRDAKPRQRKEELLLCPTGVFPEFSPALLGDSLPMLRETGSPMRREVSPMRPDVPPISGWRNVSPLPGRAWNCSHLSAQPPAESYSQGSSSPLPSPMCAQQAFGNPAADPNFLRRSLLAPPGPPGTGSRSPPPGVGTADIRQKIDDATDLGPTSCDKPEEWIPSPRILTLNQPWQPPQFK